MISSAVFVPAVPLLTKFSQSRKFKSMPKASTHVLSTSREEVYDRVPCEKLCGVLWEYVLTAACYWTSSHCIPTQKFVPVSGSESTTVHRWTPIKVCAATTPLQSTSGVTNLGYVYPCGYI